MKKLLPLLLLTIISIGLKAQYYSYTDLNGTVNPDGQSSNYENNLYDQHQIFSTGAAHIKLSFTIGEVGWFSDDNLYVYDGADDCAPLIGVYNSHNYPPDTIISTGCYLSIYFATDDVDGGEMGWSADYFGVKPLPNVYTNTTGTFADQTISNMYDNGSFFSYLIKPTGASNIVLTFTDISLNSSAVNYLWIYDGEDETASLIGAYGVNNLPPSFIQSSGNSLFIQYLYDANDCHWTAQYTGVSQNLSVTFDYDASGNRLQRNLIILPVKKSAHAEKTKQPTTKQPDKPYKDKSGNVDITIYPNPTSGELKVEIANFDFTQQSAIYVFNSLGKLIIRKSPASGSDVIDLSNYANGLYVMKLILGDKASEWKILKE